MIHVDLSKPFYVEMTRFGFVALYNKYVSMYPTKSFYMEVKETDKNDYPLKIRWDMGLFEFVYLCSDLNKSDINFIFEVSVND